MARVEKKPKWESVSVKYISLPPALMKQIAETPPKCSVDTVRNALNFKTYGENPDRIRRIAEQLGGKVKTKTKYIKS